VSDVAAKHQENIYALKQS
jgi:hypothetical protein